MNHFGNTWSVWIVISQIQFKGLGIPFIPSFSHLFSVND